MCLSQLASQIAVIFLLMLLGALARQLGFLSPTTINDLTNLVLYFLSPLVIIKAFLAPFSVTRLKIFCLTLVGVVITYLVTILLAKLAFAKVKDANLRRIATYGSIYSNNGFMGIPLAQALFGSTGVFYGVVSMVGFNAFTWTHGVAMFKKQSAAPLTRLKRVLANPNLIAIALGIVIFTVQIPVPSMLTSFLDYASAAFTPLSMIIIGSNLAGMRRADLKVPPVLGATILLRNLVFPALTIVILKCLWLDRGAADDHRHLSRLPGRRVSGSLHPAS
ncbi:Auxin efflux carrier [Limosilactobacillus fermentum CECT 5716]|nr:Auxin efflux carrier [Limosilactobacillus fermentum CECT 5716]